MSKSTYSKEEVQKLIDIIFETNSFSKEIYFDSITSHMYWVAKQLRDHGFDTEPIGSSWGVLKK